MLRSVEELIQIDPSANALGRVLTHIRTQKAYVKQVVDNLNMSTYKAQRKNECQNRVPNWKTARSPYFTSKNVSSWTHLLLIFLFCISGVTLPDVPFKHSPKSMGVRCLPSGCSSVNKNGCNENSSVHKLLVTARVSTQRWAHVFLMQDDIVHICKVA